MKRFKEWLNEKALNQNTFRQENVEDSLVEYPMVLKLLKDAQIFDSISRFKMTEKIFYVEVDGGSIGNKAMKIMGNYKHTIEITAEKDETLKYRIYLK